MHARASKRMLNRFHFIESASCVNDVYSDCGVFGIMASGLDLPSISREIALEFSLLKHDLTEEEFSRGKNLLKSEILANLERQASRLEESTRNMSLKNFPKHDQYIKAIDAVSLNQAMATLLKVFSRRPTIVLHGQGCDEIDANEIASFYS